MGKKNIKAFIVQEQPISSVKNKSTIKEENLYQFIFKNKENKVLLYWGLLIGLISFIVLRNVFPKPSFYYDSFTYIQAAKTNEQISYRPIEYSRIIQFFHDITVSDFALIFSQYFSNIISNLFLFFSLTFFFKLNKMPRIILFLLLTINPIYAIYSNYVLSDSFFCSITVAFFTTLLFTIRKPQWWQAAIQIVLLLLLFKLRYNAIIFPFFIAFAVILSKQSIIRKSIWIISSIVCLIMLVTKITDTNDELTGVRTFSPFAGWQLANNVMHIVAHDYKNIDSTTLSDESRELYSFLKRYYDTITPKYSIYSGTEVSASFMWNKNSPLKQYINPYAFKNGIQQYFIAWNMLGPVYNKFGQEIIMQKPIDYCKYFVAPNIHDYFLPSMEAYTLYNENKDTLEPVAKEYFQYSSNKIDLSGAKYYPALVHSWYYLFPVINIALLILTIFFFVAKIYKENSRFFNLSLAMFMFIYWANFFFVVGLAPTVFRYHVFIVTLSVAYIVYLIQQIAAYYTKKE